jgi:ferredoxin
MTEKEKDTEKKLSEITKEAGEKFKCPVRKAYYFVDEFLKGPMCGRCFPCSMGSYEARLRLEGIIMGKGKAEDVPALKRIADIMSTASMCKKGKDTAHYISEALAAESFGGHLSEGLCPEKECAGLIEYRVISEKCTLCGKCQEACKHNAVLGEVPVAMGRGYLPFEIRQARCIKCGDCYMACPDGAIEVVLKNQEEPVKA